MRIAILTEVFPPKIDGITNRLRNTIRCLSAAGHEICVVAPDNADWEPPGVRLVRVPALRFPRYPGLKAGLPDPRISYELARFRPDVVHAVGPTCLGVWGSLAARSLGLPLVSSYHTDYPRYLRGYGLQAAEQAVWPLIRAVHNLAEVNLCPSSFTRHELTRNGVRNVGIWRGGVDPELFHPRRRSLEMRAALTGGRPDAPLLVSVGRLAPEKRFETLAWVLDAIPEARVALVGDGPARPQLERLLPAERTHFTGFLCGEELAAAMACADVFVMPSTTETLGFVVLEAMGAGAPVVAAEAGGIPDLVRHGENGLLYDPASPCNAIEPIRGLLESRGLRLQLARMGRKVAENASWENETRRLLGSYREAIDASRSGLFGRLRAALPI